MGTSWADLFRALGDAFSVLMTSEVVALREDLAESKRKLVAALTLAGFALFVLFWAIGAAAIVLFELLSTVVSRWLAALIILLILLAIGAILARIAMFRFRSIEPPLATAQRHLDDHIAWWQSSILGHDDQHKELVDASGQGKIDRPARSRHD
jgi:uncharacterized membrane protein YqjE